METRCKYTYPVFLISAVVLAGCLAGCGDKGKTNPANNELLVRIGHAAPLTGPQAHLGKDNENGARMAIDEANAAGIMIGGKKARFELLSEDDQADPRTSTIVAQKLTDEEINGMIGHLNSGTTIPASRVYHDAGVPQISPSATNPKYTRQGFESAFRTMANDIQQGKMLGLFAVRHLAAKHIAIIDDRTAYGRGIADEFEKAVRARGARIVAHEFTTDRSTDFLAILTAIKGKQPDLLFFGGMDPQGAPLARQLRSLGITARFLGADGLYTTEFIRLAGAAAEDTYASLPGLPLEKMPGGPEFRDRYKTRYNHDIQLYAPFTYDAVNVMIAAMKRANSAEPAHYLPELAKTDHHGVTSQIIFDRYGDLKGGAVTLYQVRDGKWQLLKILTDNPLETAPDITALPDGTSR